MKKIIIILSCVIVALSAWLIGHRSSEKLQGSLTAETPNIIDSFRSYTFLNATTTTATSTNISSSFDSNGRLDNGYFVIAGAKDVTLYFSRGGATNPNTGSTNFKIQTSPDASTWYDYNALRQATTTISTADGFNTYFTGADISAATSTKIMEMADLGYYAIRCVVKETTDGEHTCKATATY